MNEAPEVMIRKRNVIWDSQVLSSWMACKRMCDFQHNLHFTPITGKGNALEIGSLAHVILQSYYESIRDGKSRSVAVADSFIEAEKYYKGDPTNPKKYPGMANTPLDNTDKPKRIGFHYVIKTMQEYFLHYSNEHWVPIDIEKVKGEVIYEDEDIRVLWKVKYDLTVDTNQGIYPVDHKTMSQRRDTLSLNNQFMGQCVVARTNSMILNKIGWQSTLKPNEKFLRPMMNYSSDRLREWVQLVGFYAKEYADFNEQKFFPPNFTHCDKFYGCIFRHVCESDRGMREEELRKEFIVGEPWEPEDS